jgi:hypothetical protein
MKLLQRMFCVHGWEAEGWDSVVCRKCGRVTTNPALNHSISKTNESYYATRIQALLEAEGEGAAVKPASCD